MRNRRALVPRLRVRNSARKSARPGPAKVLISLLLIAPLLLPVNFVFVNPGEGTPLFPKMLKLSSSQPVSGKAVSDVKTYPVDGQMFLLSIYVTNPETVILGYQVLQCWAKATCVVTPRSVIYPKQTDDDNELAIGKKEMKKSQNSALVATKKLLAKEYPDLNFSKLTDNSLNVDLKDTGGPSGGLIFALGLTELLSPENLLQGRKIAATGTISTAGAVGSIGGVQEKIVAAREAGVELLFISRENCDDLPDVVKGVRVIAVSTLEEAITALKNSKNSNFRGVQGCTNLTA
jgi:PDZ domain-containing protein